MENKIKDRQYYSELRDRLNMIHAELNSAPAEFKMGFSLSSGGVLNAYREGDIPFEKAKQYIESGELISMDNVLRRIESVLPENPYAEDLFPMTTEDYVKAIPDQTLRTAISGCIARWQFDVAKRMILKAIADELLP